MSSSITHGSIPPISLPNILSECADVPADNALIDVMQQYMQSHQSQPLISSFAKFQTVLSEAPFILFAKDGRPMKSMIESYLGENVELARYVSEQHLSVQHDTTAMWNGGMAQINESVISMGPSLAAYAAEYPDTSVPVVQAVFHHEVGHHFYDSGRSVMALIVNNLECSQKYSEEQIEGLSTGVVYPESEIFATLMEYAHLVSSLNSNPENETLHTHVSDAATQLRYVINNLKENIPAEVFNAVMTNLDQRVTEVPWLNEQEKFYVKDFLKNKTSAVQESFSEIEITQRSSNVGVDANTLTNVLACLAITRILPIGAMLGSFGLSSPLGRQIASRLLLSAGAIVFLDHHLDVKIEDHAEYSLPVAIAGGAAFMLSSFIPGGLVARTVGGFILSEVASRLTAGFYNIQARSEAEALSYYFEYSQFPIPTKILSSLLY